MDNLINEDKNLISTKDKELLLSKNKDKIQKIKDSIDILSPLSIQEVDYNVNNLLSTFNSDILKKSKVGDLEDISPLISEVLLKAKGMNPVNLINVGKKKKKSFFGLFRKAVDDLEIYKNKFINIESYFDKITKILEDDSEKQKQSLHEMRHLYDLNYHQYLNLKIIIVASEEKLKETMPLVDKMKKEVELNKNSYLAQEYQQLLDGVRRLEKKISDMNILRVDCIQTAQIINIMESNSLSQIENISQTINGAVQQWKRGISIALTLREQQNAAQRDKMVRDANNEMRIRTSEMLNQATILVVENNERSVIDFDTLVKTNENLIKTMESVFEIQANASKRRLEEKEKLKELEEKQMNSILEYGEKRKNILNNDILNVKTNYQQKKQINLLS